MAGLLDVFDDPQARLGLGLLAAASPRFDNAGMGQRLMEAVGSFDQWKQDQLKKQYMDMQMKNLQSEVDTRAAALEKQRQMQDTLAGIFGGPMSATGALSAGASVGDVGPTVTNAARMSGAPMGGASTSAPGSSRLANMSPDQLALLKANGLDLTDVYKLTRPNLIAINNTMMDPNDPKNIGKYVPDPKDGFDFQGGNVSVLPGFLKAQAAIVGGQSAAQEGAKAPFTLIDVPSSNGSTIKMPLSEYLKINQQGSQAPQNATGLPVSNALRELLLQDAKANGITNPVFNFNKPNGVAATLEGEKAPTFPTATIAPQPVVGVIGRTPTAAEKAAQEANAGMGQESYKIGAQKLYDSHELAKQASDALIGINESRKTIAGGNFGGTGAEAKLATAKALQAMGFNIAPDQVANTDYLQSQLGQGILAKAKTLGANPTDNDARIIRGIVGSITTDPQALNKLLDYQDAMYRRAIDKHNTMYQSAKGGGFTSPYDMTVTAPTFDSKPAQQSFNMLPPAAQFSGKRMMAPDGQTVYRSDGKKWIRE